MFLNNNLLDFLEDQKTFEFNDKKYIADNFEMKHLKQFIAAYLNKKKRKGNVYTSDNLGMIRIIDKDFTYKPNDLSIVPNLHQIKYGDNVATVLIRNDGKIVVRKNTTKIKGKKQINYNMAHYIDGYKYLYLIDLRFVLKN